MLSIKQTLKFIYSICDLPTLEVCFIPKTYCPNVNGAMFYTQSNPVNFPLLLINKSILSDTIRTKSVILHELGHLATVRDRRHNKEYIAHEWAIKLAKKYSLSKEEIYLKDEMTEWFLDNFSANKRRRCFPPVYRSAGVLAYKRNLINPVKWYKRRNANKRKNQKT